MMIYDYDYYIIFNMMYFNNTKAYWLDTVACCGISTRQVPTPRHGPHMQAR